MTKLRRKIFFAKAFHPPGISVDGAVRYSTDMGSLRSAPVSGGQGRELFQTVGSTAIAPGPKGIYSVFNAYPLVPGSLFFYPFPNGPLTKITSAEVPSAYGLSLSPDYRYLLYAKMSSSGADLMVVENLN